MAATGRPCSDDRTSWDETLTVYRGQLGVYLDYLIERDCSDDLLVKIEAEVRDRSVPDDFKQRFMLRVLARHVIQHMRESTRTAELMHACSYDLPIPADGTPPLERLVYFLRDVLEYSTRNTALLVGCTDANVEKLLSLARKRIDASAGPASTAIEDPNGAYFCWKLAGPHLSRSAESSL